MSSVAGRELTPEGYYPAPPAPEHFLNKEAQKLAVRFAMWLFLGTEVLLFAGIFTGYAVFRTYFPEAFEQGGKHLNVILGTLNTLLLLTSSLTVALAHH